jgi:hypothetical protein
MTVGSMLPTKKPSLRRSSGMRSTERPMSFSDELAHTAPSATSTERSTILSRNVASVIGGSGPADGSAARNAATYSLVSVNGLPTSAPSRLCTGPWLTPMPSRKRPSDISLM